MRSQLTRGRETACTPAGHVGWPCNSGEGQIVEITALGHAGFLVESGEVVLVADPWLSPEGAFDSGWMQLPRNHQLAPMVREKLSTDARQKFIYISHEHRDHFDPEFLASLPTRDVTVILGRFGRSALKDAIAALGFERIVVLDDGGKLPLPGGYARVWTVDQGVNRDSALLVRLGRVQLPRPERLQDSRSARTSGAGGRPHRRVHRAVLRRDLAPHELPVPAQDVRGDLSSQAVQQVRSGRPGNRDVETSSLSGVRGAGGLPRIRTSSTSTSSR